jgi:ABC-type transporter Mla subunit MlaD
MKKLLLSLAALSLALPACKEAQDAAKQAQDGISNAAGSAMEAGKDALGSLGEFSEAGKTKVVEQLNGLVPEIEKIVTSLKDKAGSLAPAAAEQLKKLTDYKDQLPNLINSLKDGGADVWAKVAGKASEMLKNIPELIASLQKQLPK